MATEESIGWNSSQIHHNSSSRPTGSRRLPPAKASQDWFTIRFSTWANVISPEFKAELVKKVLGQQADVSRHGIADRQLAHEICLDIRRPDVTILLGADLSSGCAIPRVSHKEILASPAALHERFANPVPCRDKTKLLLTLRQWLTDLKELQAAGNSPSKETVMQSVKTVTGGITDLNNVHELTDLLAPNCPGKLHSAIERKAAAWAVMDAGTRLSDSSARAGCQRRPQRCVQRGDSLQTSRQRHLCSWETCADSRTKDQESSGKSKKANNERSTALRKVVSGGRVCARCVDVIV